MNELPILRDGKLLEDAPVIVEAIATHPDSTQKQAEYFACFQAVRRSPDWHDRQGALVQTLLEAPSAREIVRRANVSAEKGRMAEVVFVTILSGAIHHREEEINVSRVRSILPTLLPDTATPPDRSFWRHWSLYQSVVHLRLATRSLLRAHGLSVESPSSVPSRIYSEKFIEYLALVEAWRRLALECGIPDARELWRVPEALAVPKVEVGVEPLGPSILEALRQYVPPNSSQGIEE